jgi:hypothetical protein
MKLFSALKFQVDSAVARLPLAADAMASAGINCCSIIKHHKCMQRFQMFQPARNPAFAISLKAIVVFSRI